MACSRDRTGRDGGYALVAAVISVAAFAYIAFQVLAEDQGGLAIVAGRVGQARLAAAADAGIVLAAHALASDDQGARWSLDGRPHRLRFNGVDLTITVEDERGKAPLAGLNDSQARALFAGAGAGGDRLDALVAEFRDWQTESDSLALAPPAEGPPVRHGPIRTIGELAGLKDMDPGLLARIAPAVTVFFEENGPFNPRDASPLAVATMNADIGESPDQIASEAQAVEQRPDEELASDGDLQGHPVTVRVTAVEHDGAHTHRMAIVELTGDVHQPYWVRYVE